MQVENFITKAFLHLDANHSQPPGTTFQNPQKVRLKLRLAEFSIFSNSTTIFHVVAQRQAAVGKVV